MGQPMGQMQPEQMQPGQPSGWAPPNQGGQGAWHPAAVGHPSAQQHVPPAHAGQLAHAGPPAATHTGASAEQHRTSALQLVHELGQAGGAQWLAHEDQDTLTDWLLIEPVDGSGPLTQLLHVASVKGWDAPLVARRCRRFLQSIDDDAAIGRIRNQ